MNNREKIIENYIAGYNKFDIDGMMKDFEEGAVFENVQNGEVTLTLSGLADFKKQAEEAKAYFSERQQTIKSFSHREQQTEIEIDYIATLAMDFPNGLKKGEELRLSGKSVFEFSENGKIRKLTDIS